MLDTIVPRKTIMLPDNNFLVVLMDRVSPIIRSHKNYIKNILAEQAMTMLGTMQYVRYLECQVYSTKIQNTELSDLLYRNNLSASKHGISASIA